MSVSKLSPIMLTVASLFLESCSVGMAINGKADPDLSVVKKNGDRDEIEFQLGAPKEVSTVNGDTIAKYEYELGNDSSPGRAVAHGAMDILTLGIWEVVGTPVELASGDKYELQIIYDQNNKVKALKKKNI